MRFGRQGIHLNPLTRNHENAFEDIVCKMTAVFSGLNISNETYDKAQNQLRP